MKIKSVSIKNFRGIEDQTFECDNLNLIIGDNGTCKTSIIEAINLCLSSSYAASRLSIEDFFGCTDNDIEIKITFENNFMVQIPDGYTTQDIECNGIILIAKKRERAAPGKAFNDLVVAEQYYLPVQTKSGTGWSIQRQSGNRMNITERQLATSYASAEIPKSFYYGKNRDRQLQKGFNSSMSNILDDLNWRFEKKQRSKPDADKFKHKRKETEDYVFDNTDGDTLNKTIVETNRTLSSLNIPEIDISLIKTLTPYDNSEIVKRFDGFELPVNKIGSGIEMIIALVFLETLAKISRSEICIIIDEPELHLHPILQDKFAQHLLATSSTSQVFISTHSPFFFKNCFSKPNVKSLISELENNNLTISDANSKGFGLLKWSPSWGEICFIAYKLPTIEFHDDLYSSLQDKNNTEKISETETWLISKGQTKEIKWPHSVNGPEEETLMTFIRNRIHHPDNTNRPMYTPQQLEDSIKRMIQLLSNP